MQWAGKLYREMKRRGGARARGQEVYGLRKGGRKKNDVCINIQKERKKRLIGMDNYTD